MSYPQEDDYICPVGNTTQQLPVYDETNAS